MADCFIVRRGGGGGGKVTVTVRGACGATVTITGDANTSLLLAMNGDGTILLKKGNYTFSDNLSGYVKQVAITEKNQVVDLWYEGVTMLYWYGREFADITGGWTSTGYRRDPSIESNGTATKTQASMVVNSGSNSTACMGTVNPISAGAQITFRCKVSAGNIYARSATNRNNVQDSAVTNPLYTNSKTPIDFVVAYTSAVDSYPVFFTYSSNIVGEVWAVWIS